MRKNIKDAHKNFPTFYSLPDINQLQAWLIQVYYNFTTYRAGLTKRSLSVDGDGSAIFSYCEKGIRVNGKPSIVFIHGLSSNKETWLPIVQNIPDTHHCITVDLPGHGNTIGLNEEHYTIEKFADRLKLFFDKQGLTEPLCLVGASLGGAIVLMFALKYPSYVKMICLLAPPANEKCETELIKQLRSGVYKAILPETPEDLRVMINTLTVKRIKIPQVFINGFLDLRLRLLPEHTKVLASLLEYDYPNLEHHYQKLATLNKPTLILWGRQDKLFTSEGADYFCTLMPHAEKVVFDDCGHFLAMDKAQETAESIVSFYDRCCNRIICTFFFPLMGASNSKIAPSPFAEFHQAVRKKAESMHFIQGRASAFYFLCANGKTDEVRSKLDAEDCPPIEELNKLQPNGSTALHAATYYNHPEIVKLFLDRNCSRIKLNRFGKTAYEEASTDEMKQLFRRCDTANRFFETDTMNAMAVFLPEENTEGLNVNGTHDYVQVFKTDAEILEYTINQQTTAMWLKFVNWFVHTFQTFIETDNFRANAFDLVNHPDFKQFLDRNLSPANVQKVMTAINEAQQRNSIEPLVNLYTNEEIGFYRPFNQFLAQSTSNQRITSNLCDRFVFEFYIRRKELKSRAFTGVTHRGATMSVDDLAIYRRAMESDPPGVLGLKAFTSTSRDAFQALNFALRNPLNENQIHVLFVFEIDKPSETIFGIDDISEYGAEEEVLILPGNLFTVMKIVEQSHPPITRIMLKHWYTPVSFWTKIKQTIRAGRKSVIMSTPKD